MAVETHTSPPEQQSRSATPANAPGGARRRRRASGPVRRGPALRLAQAAFIAGVIGLWWLVTSVGIIKPLLSRTPADVWRFLEASARSGELFSNLGATLEATLLAFVLASAVGIVIGISLGLLPRVEAVVDPFMDALNSMPRIALGPVFIIYFGIGIAAKIALAFTIVVFILIYNARAGVRSADPDILRLSRALGATKKQLFWKILLPVSIPAIFAGLRLGLIYALLGAVTSEIIASREGLGQMIMTYSGTFKLEGVYGILVVLAIVGMLLNSIMLFVERRILRWQPPAES